MAAVRELDNHEREPSRNDGAAHELLARTMRVQRTELRSILSLAQAIIVSNWITHVLALCCPAAWFKNRRVDAIGDPRDTRWNLPNLGVKLALFLETESLVIQKVKYMPGHWKSCRGSITRGRSII